MDEYNNHMIRSGKVEEEARGMPALIPSQIGQINFHGDELQVLLVETEDQRRVYVPVRQFCIHLGLDWASQYQCMKRDRVLAAGMAAVVITTMAGPWQRS